MVFLSLVVIPPVPYEPPLRVDSRMPFLNSEDIFYHIVTTGLFQSTVITVLHFVVIFRFWLPWRNTFQHKSSNSHLFVSHRIEHIFPGTGIDF